MALLEKQHYSDRHSISMTTGGDWLAYVQWGELGRVVNQVAQFLPV